MKTKTLVLVAFKFDSTHAEEILAKLGEIENLDCRATTMDYKDSINVQEHLKLVDRIDMTLNALRLAISEMVA